MTGLKSGDVAYENVEIIRLRILHSVDLWGGKRLCDSESATDSTDPARSPWKAAKRDAPREKSGNLPPAVLRSERGPLATRRGLDVIPMVNELTFDPFGPVSGFEWPVARAA